MDDQVDLVHYQEIQIFLINNHQTDDLANFLEALIVVIVALMNFLVLTTTINNNQGKILGRRIWEMSIKEAKNLHVQALILTTITEIRLTVIALTTWKDSKKDLHKFNTLSSSEAQVKMDKYWKKICAIGAENFIIKNL